jgi:predicted enzyme related to lactoylglutathione lyase
VFPPSEIPSPAGFKRRNKPHPFVTKSTDALSGSFQTQSQGSHLKVLGITVPIFVTDFESATATYEKLLGEAIQHKFEVPSKGISVAKIGSLLIIGGSEGALSSLRQIRATLRVDSLDEYFAHLSRTGAAILQPPAPTPTGHNMIAQGTDGVVFEYVELREGL